MELGGDGVSFLWVDMDEVVAVQAPSMSQYTTVVIKFYLKNGHVLEQQVDFKSDWYVKIRQHFARD